MAEFLEQPKQEPSQAVKDGFNRMGHPIGFDARQVGYEHCVAMGITDKATAMQCVQQVSEMLERDKPYEAMAAGMRHLDLTGTYRLFAVLLTA